MKRFDSGRVQEKLLNRLERKEKQDAFQRDRFFKFKLPEIHTTLSQTLLMEKIIETDNPAAVSDLLLKGLKQAQRTNEFEFKYFTAPIRSLVPHPDPISLYMTQYILEVVINDPSVIDIYGTDLEIYKVVNGVISKINMKFERTEEEILRQLSRNKSLIPGSREYDIALDQLFRQKMGEPQK
ncbi:MAG: DUF507 family protein [Deltaproteobacteria bacterium]|nr:DUF507 family protein [Deltaproteobacteria bacterium]MBW1920675.1 DUF507 family protein [Deltaproteobacteria bacterium]MBW1935187.1 DUF507 family protein [Deltaproteobacteria bacterium]MBW1977588.1 DUF507 family protein [Deltaproteobacteria bacterium]MBW2044004.1 DUF507 family protein [Deltaproteobacteria bacterium]